MNRLDAKHWMVALLAAGGMAGTVPAEAEVVYARASLTDTTMRMQLCARKDVDGSCMDGLTTAKQRLLLPPAPSEDPPPESTLPPPVIDELPPVRESAPLVPIAATPNAIAVPEPGSLSLAALGTLLIVAALRRGRRSSPSR